MFYYWLFVLGITFSSVASEETFGMRLTTEKPKAKEDTKYLFRYFVKDDKTGDFKVQEETREGDSVKGSYTIGDPNGDLRTVKYKAGPGKGFEATVDVQPSASPMKIIAKATENNDTVSQNKTNLNREVESTVKNFPGGFIMEILSKPESETKTEVGMTFSMKPNESETATTTTTMKPTEKIENETTELTPKIETTHQTTEEENSTFLGESRDISEDPIEKEINEAANYMPKMPEFILPDNITHFKFHKDPEEAALDERITQIARQLAETSLRREYEERKLGHFIPISLRPIETPAYLSKSFKFDNEVTSYKPTEPAPVQVLTQIRVVPQYIYHKALIPKLPTVQNIPILGINTVETSSASETIPENASTKAKKKINEINKILKIERANYETNPEPIPVMPVHIPTFLQFMSPIQRFMMETQKPFSMKPKLYVSPMTEDITTIPVENDTAFYAVVTDQKKEKS